MIIYGSKSTPLLSEQLFNVKCQSCGKDSINMHVYGKYAHVYWIPFFPIGKTGISECQNCKQVTEEKAMPSNYKEGYTELKSKAKTPWWHFSGLAVIAAIVCISLFTSSNHKKDEIGYLQTPLKGDVYKYKTKTGYSTMKVDSVSSDSVFVLLNTLEHNKMSKVYKIDKAENYEKTRTAIAREEILNEYQKGEIYSIDR